MAIIQKENIQICGASEFTKITKFSAKTHKFSIELPEHYKKLFDTKTVESETLNGVNKKFNQMIKDYDKLKSTRKKVISYSFSYDGYLENNGKPVLDTREDYQQDEEHKQRSYISVSYKIIYLYKLDHYETYQNEDGSSAYSSHDDKVIDWTAEREDFFKNLVKSIAILAYKGKNFFDQDDVLLKIDSFAGNLLDFKKDEMKVRRCSKCGYYTTSEDPRDWKCFNCPDQKLV
jgi:hypothetical protein